MAQIQDMLDENELPDKALNIAAIPQSENVIVIAMGQTCTKRGKQALLNALAEVMHVDEWNGDLMTTPIHHSR